MFTINLNNKSILLVEKLNELFSRNKKDINAVNKKPGNDNTLLTNFKILINLNFKP